MRRFILMQRLVFAVHSSGGADVVWRRRVYSPVWSVKNIAKSIPEHHGNTFVAADLHLNSLIS